MGRTVTPVGKVDAGNQHVQFDERGRETERTIESTATAPVLELYSNGPAAQEWDRSWGATATV